MTISLVHDATKLPTDAAMAMIGHCAALIDLAEDSGSAKFALATLQFFWKKSQDPEVKDAAAYVLLNHLADLYLEDIE